MNVSAPHLIDTAPSECRVGHGGNKKLGILGGTFNPVHYGHLILAQEAYEQLSLDRVVFVPTWKPGYRTIDTHSYDDRNRMLCNVVVNDERFAVSDVEYVHDLRFTIDVLSALRDEYSDWKQYLIIGGDQAGKFFTWQAAELILLRATIVCAERALYNRGRISDHWGDHKHLLNFLDMPSIDISSSLIRTRVKAGCSIRYFVPPAVEEFIAAEALYVG